MKDIFAYAAWGNMHSSARTNGIARLRSVAPILLAGGFGLALTTWICFRWQAGLSTVGFIYLTEILLLSLTGSMLSSVAFSLIAVGCLNFFFTPPLFAFRVDAPQDVAALTAFFVSSFVVTFLVHRNRRLAKVHREQAQLLDLTHDSVVVRDMADVITYWNNGAEALYGWNRREAVGRRAQPLLRTRFPVPIEDINKTLIAMGRWEGEIIHTRHDGSQAAVASRWALVRDSQGRAIATLETATDITERKRIEERLQHVSRLTSVGELGASVAHEIAQPLAAIATQASACLGWLDRDTPNLERVQTCVQRILVDDERATQIVRRIRMLATRAAPAMTPLKMNDVINEVVALVQGEVLKYNVTLRTGLDPALPPVLGDPIQLAQVITNLVTNALQSMTSVEARPRELMIESRGGDEGYVTVSVQDLGTGIDAQHADRLFEPFFTTKPEGMGVGLSICHSIIDAHGGHVWAENNAGYGATFRFTIPVIRDSEQNF